MRILIVNKFLFPNGGSETYIFKLGEYLQSIGHEVQYFGMEHENRCVGNRVNSYTSKLDFHDGNKIAKIIYPFKTIYSLESRKKIRIVLDDFKPDVVHLNNFNYQLTPSVIVEIVAWRKKEGRECRILYTAHDYQLVCPNHMCRNPNTRQNCERCLEAVHRGRFIHCIKGRCIHGSMARSMIGSIEAWYWNSRGIYKYIDKIICCSEFLKKKMDSNPIFAERTVTIHNFVEKKEEENGASQEVSVLPPKDYILYFGRFSKEKGIAALIEVCRMLPEIDFIFAGLGPLEEELKGVQNIKNVGFQSGEALMKLIQKARFSVYPSEWYENCPYSVMESQMLGTPVLGADIGGIPELISQGETGELFEPGDNRSLAEKIKYLWDHPEVTEKMSRNCRNVRFEDTSSYIGKLLNIYSGGGIEVNLCMYIKPKYVLYSGRYSEEKGIGTLLKAAKELPDIWFVFAGKGLQEIEKMPNVTDIGFQVPDRVQILMENAVCTVLPAEWYEPFGLSVAESQSVGTPVIGSRIGGITELIKDGINGELFESGNVGELKGKIEKLWNADKDSYRRHCKETEFVTREMYCEQLMQVYL